MTRGIPLTEFQESQATAYKKGGKTIREIVGILKIGKSAIADFLWNPKDRRKRKKLEDTKK